MDTFKSHGQLGSLLAMILTASKQKYNILKPKAHFRANIVLHVNE